MSSAPLPPTRPPSFPSQPSVPTMPGTPVPTKPPGIMPLIDNSPLKKVKKIIEENKLNTTSLPFPPKIPGLGDIAGKVISQGLGSVFQNPMASSLGQMSSAISSATSMLGGMTGASGPLGNLTSALSNLQSSMGSLSSVTSALSGTNLPGEGQFGLSDLLSHATSAAGVGSSLPAGLGLEQAMGPLNLQSQVTQMASMLPNIMSQVGAGVLHPDEAASSINEFANNSNAVVDNHVASMTSMGQVTEALSQVSTAAEHVSEQNPATLALLEQVMQPEVFNAIKPGSSVG